MKQLLLVMTLLASRPCLAEERLDVWPDLAPGETTRLVGEAQPSLAKADMGPAPLVQVLRLVAEADRGATSSAGDPEPAAAELPLRVRYSRLAL